MPSKFLSHNFTLDELIATSHRDIDNRPNEQVIENLTVLANALESVRALLNAPVIITSGYRCPDLNAAVGGSRGSRHMLGLAADLISPRYGTPLEVALCIAGSELPFDQLIYEHTWVHFGLAIGQDEPRRQVLTLVGYNAYARGIIEK